MKLKWIFLIDMMSIIDNKRCTPVDTTIHFVQTFIVVSLQLPLVRALATS